MLLHAHAFALYCIIITSFIAGMTFAVMAILGHFSKTLLLFFIPQVFNFVYSLPQLFKVVPCPRHRMPDYDSATDRLRPSTFTYVAKRGAGASARLEEQTMSAVSTEAVASSRVSKRRRQQQAGVSTTDVKSGVAMQALPEDRHVVRDNMTLINLVLRLTGPMHERTTANLLLFLQVVCCALGLLLRYHWSPQVYEAVPLQPAEHTASGSTLAG